MLRGIWAGLALVVMTVLCSLPVLILALLVPRRFDLPMRACKLWSRSMLSAVGSRVTYHGLEHVELREPRLYVANHQSMVDIWALSAVLPLSTRFVAKAELFRIPIFGWAMAVAGFVPVARASRAQAIESLERAETRVREGLSLVLFPEGTRSADGRLGPFKKGAFHLALAAGVPVVPVAITGSFEILPPRSMRFRPGAVEVRFEPAVDVTPFQPSNCDALLAQVRETIARRVEP